MRRLLIFTPIIVLWVVFWIPYYFDLNVGPGSNPTWYAFPYVLTSVAVLFASLGAAIYAIVEEFDG